MAEANPRRFKFALIPDGERRAMAVVSDSILGPAPIMAALERAVAGVEGALVEPAGPRQIPLDQTDAASTYAHVTLGQVAFDRQQSWELLRALANKIVAEFDAAGFNVEILGFPERT